MTSSARLRQGFRLRQGCGGQDGYVLLGVTIILVIMGIFMGLAVPVWQHVMQREREEELLWRGRQYVQAIELYQRKHPGAFPPNVEILVEQKFLRKAYADPMAEDGEWKVLRQLSPEIQQMMTPGRQQGQRGPGGRAQQQRQEQQEQERQRRTSSFQRGRPRGGNDDAALGGVVGVVSSSEEESIRILEGKTKYNEWLFIYAGNTRGNRQPGAGRRGQPGQQPPGAPGAPRTPGAPGPGQKPRPKGPGGIQNPRSPSQ